MQNLPTGRKMSDNTLTKTYTFKTYMETMKFANHVAMCAEQLDHHPDMHISYGKIIVTTTTHDAKNTVTEKDYDLVDEIEDQD